MVHLVLIRPGSTQYDQQGRIQGTLDIPLSESGKEDAARTANELRDQKIEAIYAAPCLAAQETAQAVAEAFELKVKKLDKLQNVNLGLWQGMLLEDVKHKQPKVYRLWQEHPETVCPPQGETLDEVQERIQKNLQKVFRRHSEGVFAMVLPEPLHSLVRHYVTGRELGDLWKPAANGRLWETFDVEPETLAASS